MSELTDLIAVQQATKAKLEDKLDWHNGVNKTYFVGQSKSETHPAEWTGAGRAGFLQWHNAQGVNEDDLDQLFVDMYAEYIDTEIGGANALEVNADLVTTMQASITSYAADIAHLQSRVDAGDTTLADS